MKLLMEHLKIAMFLGVLSVGFIQGLKQKEWFTLEGTQLAIFTSMLEVAVSGLAGYYYLGIVGQELFVVVLLTVVGAEAIYGVIKPVVSE